MRKFIIIMFCVLGLIVGIIVGRQCAPYPALSWLSWGPDFVGITQPLVINLEAMTLTFGFTFSINIGGVFGLVLFAVLAKWITGWLKI